MCSVVRLMVGSALLSTAFAAPALAATWYVQAGAQQGDGTEASPFGTLTQVEAASGAGDIIYVIPAKAALDGGIALKSGQVLAGLPDTGEHGMTASITNTHADKYNGNGVMLADFARVEHLEIVDVLGSAVAGTQLKGAVVRDNRMLRHNQGNSSFCWGDFMPMTRCFVLGTPAIMLEAARTGSSKFVVEHNVISRGAGSGFMIDMAGTAEVRLEATGNRIEQLIPTKGRLSDEILQGILDPAAREAASKSEKGWLVQGLLFRSRDTASLDAVITDTVISDLGGGPEGADTNNDGMGTRFSDKSKTRMLFDRFVYRNSHHWGNTQASAMEFVVTPWADAATAGRQFPQGGSLDVDIRNSDLQDAKGVGVQLISMAAHWKLGFRMSDTLVRGAQGDAAVQLWELGGEDSWAVDMQRNRIEGSARYGLVLPGGEAHARFEGVSAKGSSFDVALRDNMFTDNKIAAVGVAAVDMGKAFAGKRPDPLKELRLYAAGNIFQGNGAVLTLDKDSVESNVLDFGGGMLGSPGLNHFVGNATSFALANYMASAQRNWWGVQGCPSVPKKGAGSKQTALRCEKMLRGPLPTAKTGQ